MTDLESTDDDISEIQAEIAHLSAVHSPYVTKYYGSFVRGYRLWIVMEYLAGGSCLDLASPSDYCITKLIWLAETGSMHRSSNCNSLPRATLGSIIPT
jgi:serine/threonine protein kinase